MASCVEDEKKTNVCDNDKSDSFAATTLKTYKFPKKFQDKFNVLPTYKPQYYGVEAVFKGEKDRRKPYYTTDADFYSRVGQLNMTFVGLKDNKNKYKPFVGTATIFYVNHDTKRAYAITCGHNLIHYNPLTKTTHLLKCAWFDSRVTRNCAGMTRSSSERVYKVDQKWIHPQYDHTEAINHNDLAIISFQYEDKDNLPVEAVTNFEGLSIVGYPGEKQGQLWGEMLPKKTVSDMCNAERNGLMISYKIHTSGGQSGSCILQSAGAGIPKVVGIHTSTNSLYSNYGVVLNKQKIKWIKKCVSSSGENRNTRFILRFFDTL